MQKKILKTENNYKFSGKKVLSEIKKNTFLVEGSIVIYKPANIVVKVTKTFNCNKIRIKYNTDFITVKLSSLKLLKLVSGFNPIEKRQKKLEIPIIFTEDDLNKKISNTKYIKLDICEKDLKGIYYHYLFYSE